MNWDYYESVQRFHRILDAQGISEALKDEGAMEGDLVMIGEWDFTYNDRKNRWLSELGMEDVKPRKRRSPGGEGENHEKYQDKEMSTYAKIEQEIRESTSRDNIPTREIRSSGVRDEIRRG